MKKLSIRYNKLKTDAEKINFILTELKEDDIGASIDKIDKNTYRLGAIWNNILFEARLFNMMKGKLKMEKEFDGKWYTYWVIKEA